MWKLLPLLFLCFSTFAKADDYEKISYKCRCSCYDLYLTREIRYRLPGGGFGSYRGALHLVEHQPNWGWSHERLIPNVSSAQQCQSYNSSAYGYQRCGGYTDLPTLGGRWSDNGYLTQCRYTPY